MDQLGENSVNESITPVHKKRDAKNIMDSRYK